MTTAAARAANYPLETTGAIKKSNFLLLNTSQLVDDVIGVMRTQGRLMRGIHYLYVEDENQRLRGVLSLRELISTEGSQRIVDIMKGEVISLPLDMDQEEAAQIMKDCDYVSLPVVNDAGKMIGVIHAEDIIDVIHAEATEDFHKMAPVGNVPMNVKKAGTFFLFRKRIVWLVVLVFMNVFSGAGIAFFEDTIAASIALVFFLPLLVDSGGNAGSQSATLMIRALAVGDIEPRDWFRLFAKEIGIALLLGVAMAVAVSGIGYWRGGAEIAVIVSLTMLLVVIVGSLVGMTMPFVFSKIDLDPATASGPLVTSFADIIGVLIYFSIATWYLGL